ncbi:MAG: hypothetical protein K0Q78_154, partial [Cellvibrio sp.]|nr:hypothetical protein [Cellvibrio sp.]
SYVTSFATIHNLVGGDSGDTLLSINQDNDWKITGSNTGALGALDSIIPALEFAGIENLIGNQALDIFTFTNVQSYITGLIDGGSSITQQTTEDSINLSALTDGVVVELGNNDSNNLNLANIETITASSENPDANVIIGASDKPYRWNITAPNSGSIEVVEENGSAISPLLETSVSFTNFGDLRGGTNNDRFNVQATVSKNISGGAGIDLVDYSGRIGSFTITLGGDGSLGNTGINNIEGIIGNSGDDNTFNSIINVTDGNNIWTIGAFDTTADGLNDGTVNINGKTVSFENFNQLIGGLGNDTFNYSAKGQLVGLIDGGAGNNIVNASLSTKTQEFYLNGDGSGVTNLVRIAGLTGNSATNSSLVRTASDNIWNVDNQGIGKLNNSFDFTGIANLKGGAFSDVFNIENITPFSGFIDGGGSVADEINLTQLVTDINVVVGAAEIADLKILNIESINANAGRKNTLVADNLIDNAWLISGTNTGTLNTSLSFSGFANLIGRETSDTFTFANELSNITGWIDAGDGFDRLDLTTSNRNLVVRIASENMLVSNGEIITKNFESIDADAARNNKLIANNIDNIWAITATNSGRLSDTTATEVLDFKNFQNLTGGNQNDTFIFESIGAIAGLVDGASHRERDIVDVSKSANANIVITGENTNNGYSNIERYVGNNTTSTITGDNRINNWVVTNNSGTINSTIEFEQFANLIGGNNQDTFALANAILSGYIDAGEGNDTFMLAGSAIAGELRGSAGDDLFDLNVVSGFTGSTNLLGGLGVNRVVASGGDTGYKATHQAGVIQYANAVNATYTANYSDVAEIVDNVVADSLTIWGTSANDIFRLQNNKYQLNPAVSINYLQKQNLIINGSSADQVIVDGNVSIPGMMTVNNASITAENAGKIIGQSLELVATQAIGSAANRVQLAVDDIYLKSTNGNIYLQEQDSLNLKGFSTSATDTFDVSLGGDLLSAVDITYAGLFSVDSLRGGIALDNANSFTGNLYLKAAGNITLKNLTSVNFTEVAAQNLTIETDGAVNAGGPMIVNGLTSISANSTVSLLHADNDFNSLKILKADNVSLRDRNSLTLAGVSAAGFVSMNTNGAINIGASCTDNCTDSIGLRAAKPSASDAIALGNGDSYGIRAANLDLNAGTGAITVGKNITVNESVTLQANGITVNDIISAKRIFLKAGSGVLLLNESGHLHGQAGDLIELAGNKVEQRADIASNGNITVTASDDVQMAKGAVTESISGSVVYSGRNIALAGIKSLGGSVNLTATGAITDSNDSEINIYANRWSADAVSGIGLGHLGLPGQDAIETDVDILSVRNAGKLLGHTNATINIVNTDSLIIEQLRKNVDISITNLTVVFILDNANNERFDISINDARIQGGVINTNTGANGGALIFSIPNGMVSAKNRADKGNPDIIASFATFDYPVGTRFSFGDRNRKIVMHIPDVYSQTAKTSSVVWHLRKPTTIVDKSKALSELDSLTSDQLIQIEGLNEIDPAIFTSVRNYIHDEVAILMPVDQRFEDDEYAE